jgi:class 3 adenylate cyclase
MAVEMQQRIAGLNAKWRNAGIEYPFRVRMGINTGFCNVGNFGSNDRMDYTIIGNAVNLTARLQSHAEIDGVLLGHETYSLVKDEVAAEEQTPIKVKGFAEPVRCYKVQGLYDHLAEEGTVIREEQEGFKFHLNLQKRDKKDAIRILEGILLRLKS